MVGSTFQPKPTLSTEQVIAEYRKVFERANGKPAPEFAMHSARGGWYSYGLRLYRRSDFERLTRNLLERIVDREATP